MGFRKDIRIAERLQATMREPEAGHSGAAPLSWLAESKAYRPRGHQGIARVPTHAVGRTQERRAYIRARLTLPLRVERIAGQRDVRSHSLHTRDISSSGVFFNYPHSLEAGTPIEFEVLLVDRPHGRGSVKMRTMAHVVRAEDMGQHGWHGVAASFDDISFVRDDNIASC